MENQENLFNYKRKTRIQLYRADGRYCCYRIPGMTVTAVGTLLTVCEARHTSDDWGRMDILLRRSEDGGKTFSEPVVIAEGTQLHPTVNNPVLVCDDCGRIHFFYCEDYAVNGGRVLQRISKDDGLTWSECRDITASTQPEVRNVFAFGPGHGICTENGTLLIPFWRVPKRYRAALYSHFPSEIGTLWSRDNGETWHVGEILSTRDGLLTPNETEIAELSDGRIYLNTRLGVGLTYRAHAYSKNGIDNWENFEPDFETDDPICFGSCVTFSYKSKRDVLCFANCDSKTERKNVTLRLSLDCGKSWCCKHVIDKENGGYVELAADSRRRRIYVLYEENAGAAQHLVTFGL